MKTRDVFCSGPYIDPSYTERSQIVLSVLERAVHYDPPLVFEAAGKKGGGSGKPRRATGTATRKGGALEQATGHPAIPLRYTTRSGRKRASADDNDDGDEEGQGDKKRAPAAPPSPTPPEGIAEDDLARMHHALFVREGIDLHLFEMEGELCDAPSRLWAEDAVQAWLENSGLSPDQNPDLHNVTLPTGHTLRKWLKDELNQPPWKRFDQWHARGRLPIWNTFEPQLRMPDRHPANYAALRRAVATWELHALRDGRILPIHGFPANVDDWNSEYWDTFFLDRHQMDVRALPPYYVANRDPATKGKGPPLTVVDPVPSHARWLVGAWPHQPEAGYTDYVPPEQQKLPEDVAFYYDEARLPYLSAKLNTAAEQSDREPCSNVMDLAAYDDSRSWLAQPSYAAMLANAGVWEPPMVPDAPADCGDGRRGCCHCHQQRLGRPERRASSSAAG
eukprot:tig00000180_g13615.t2